MSEVNLDETIDQPRLRVELLTPEVTVVVGQSVTLVMQILNTTPVIETVTLQLLSLMAETTHQHPEKITLFPEESLQAELELQFHATLPAGRHEGLLVVAGGSGTVPPTEIPVVFEVPTVAAMSLQVEPPVRTGGRVERFEVVLDNTGNTPLDLRLTAVDAGRVCELTFNRPRQALHVDQYGTSDLLVRAKRKWTGSPTDHAITVTAESGELVQTADVLYRQKAVLTPGVITLLTLALIVGLWATIMLVGIEQVFDPPPPTKTIPATFEEGISAEQLDPALVGGSIIGGVVATSTEAPVERVTVEVFASDGSLVNATATDADGAYELDGLLPGRYRLRMRAVGYTEQWWPDAPDAAGAAELPVSATAPSELAATPLTGQVSTLGGQVVAGDGDVVVTNVEVAGLDLVEPAAPQTATTDETGVWSVAGLTAPATYEITYTAPGYAPVVVTQEVGAGEQLTVNPTRLPAAPGGISGRVESRDGVALGGVEVLAQRGDVELGTTTPTSGDIGAFTFTDLETPGTYLLTFTAEGYASETQGVRLEPGQEVTDLVISLSEATGTVVGSVTGTDGQPIGGVTVTVSGGDSVLTTDTLTSGDVGTFRLPGLPLPGTYTVNFDAEGYSRETVQVSIGPDASIGTANATLTASVGSISGQVLGDDGAPVVGAELRISDGDTVRETTSASAPAAQRGRFNVGNLPVGAYTITVTTADGRTLTVLESVGAATTSTVTLRLPPP